MSGNRKRIAIVDLLFMWPPDCGARIDTKEIAERLSVHADVTLFVPDYTRYYRRGKISGDFSFSIVKLPFHTFSFNALQVGRSFSRAIDDFAPEIVFIADGWFMKPRLFEALKKYRPWVRFYTYENFCLRGHGTLIRSRTPCPHTRLEPGLAAYARCNLCALQYIAQTRLLHFFQEYVGAGTWLPFYGKAVENMLREAGGIIVYNDYITSLAKPYNDNIHKIPSGIDVCHFSPDQNVVDDREVSPVRIGLVGRITDVNKGFSFLNKACRELVRQGVQLELHVTADVPTRYNESYIRVSPWLNQEQLPGYYRSLDICVVPSLWPEPFGIVALEAMACGKPVVATNIGGLKETVLHGKTGFLVEPNDVQALVEALKKLANDRTLRREMGQAGRDRVTREYQWDHIFNFYYKPIWDL